MCWTMPWLAFRHFMDPGETAVAVARALAASPVEDVESSTRQDRERRVGTALLFRGRMSTMAARILFQNPGSIPPQLVEAALLSAGPPDSAAVVFHRWLSAGPVLAAAHALPWWAAQGDSASIRQLARTSGTVSRSTTKGVDRDIAAYTHDAALAYLDLVRRDTAAAIRRLEALPDSLCVVCYLERLTLVQLLSARHDDEKATRLLDAMAHRARGAQPGALGAGARPGG